MSEQRYLSNREACAFFDSIPDPMWVYDSETLAFLDANQAALNKLGYTRKQLLGKTIADIRPPEDIPAIRAAVKAIKAKKTQAGIWRIIARDGSVFHADFHWQVVDFHGQRAILATVRDVSSMVETERQREKLQRKAETTAEHLQEQQTYLRTAERLLGLGIWKFNIDTGELLWLNNVRELYSVDPTRQIHNTDDYTQLVHPDDREAMMANLKTYLAAPGKHFHFQHRVIQHNGRVITVKGLAELTQTADGRMLTGVVRDVTDEIEQADKLSRATSMLRIAGQTAHLGGWRVDLRNNAIEWSEETAAIHETGAEGPQSLDEALSYYVPDSRERVTTLFNQCTESGAPFDENLELITARGRRIWVRSIGEPEYIDGQIVAVRGAFQDITEQVRAKTELQALSQRLYQTLQHMSEAFMLLDHDFRISYVNRAAEEVLQQNGREIVGELVRHAFPYEDTEAFMEHYQRAMDTGESVDFRRYFEPLNAWFRVVAHPVSEGLAIYFRDVTEEFLQSAHLRLLEAAVSQQNDILLITEAEPLDAPEGPKIVYVNDAFTRRTGYTREEAIGQTPRILQGPGTQRHELDRIGQALRNWQPVRAELINYTKTGEEYWLELDIVPLADDRGRYTHWVAVERDISERKAIEEAARISEERFQMAVNATSDVIWDWDFQTDQIWWNGGLLELFGYDLDNQETAVDFWVDRIHPDDRDEVVATIQQVIDSHDLTDWEYEYRFLHANGNVCYVNDRGSIIRNEQGSAIRMVGGLIDITEQREMADRLRQSQKLEAVGQLTGGVAHDFNNLLTVILGNAELLREQLAGDQQLRGLAELTATAAARGAELTNRLLAFARRQTLEPQILDINRLLTNMETLLRRTLHENVDIELVQAGGLWTTEADPGQLESAILNLAINARDAMPSGGHLTIETANCMLDDRYASEHQEVRAGQYVKVSISDTGTGMSPEVIAQAFEPFYTTKPVGKGSGLGLSMVYGFVKQSGGHIKIYSEPGEGTTIKLYFPRVQAGKTDLQIEPERQDVRGGQEHILLVEDDHLVRQHVMTMLKGLGYRVTSAETGPQALEIIQQIADIDLLFTDIIMPGGLNGRQLADSALELRPELKILYTSGYTENAIVHHGRLDQGLHLLSKPYRRQELAVKLRKVLDEN